MRAGALASAHDVSDGGLAVRARRVLHRGRVGARIELSAADEAALFGEGPGGVVVSGPRAVVEALPGAA